MRQPLKELSVPSRRTFFASSAAKSTKATTDLSAPRHPQLEERFKFGELLGTGCFSSVFAAKDRTDYQEYAVKFIPQDETDPHGLGYSFEECTAPYLAHPNLVEHIESIVLPVSEYTPASLLVFIMKQAGKPLPPRSRPPIPRALQIVSGAGAALAYLHDLKIAHGNVGRGSLLLDERGHVTLTSLGYARRCAGADAGEPGPELLKEDVSMLAGLGLQWLVGADQNEEIEKVAATFEGLHGIPKDLKDAFLRAVDPEKAPPIHDFLVSLRQFAR
ncbi:hypothetical protein HK104_004316 [Borealophlyctis nickersoniae]|nr:hypothetical protein HK104_004316 [Borealophlyctis nickersoniae]